MRESCTQLQKNGCIIDSDLGKGLVIIRPHHSIFNAVPQAPWRTR
jgi:hypothetical protein